MMKAEIREKLARVAYEGRKTAIDDKKVTALAPAWENMPDAYQELYRKEVDAVVLALAEMLIPALQNMAAILTDRTVEIHLSEPVVVNES